MSLYRKFCEKNKITIKHHITTNDSINKHFNNDFSHQGIALKVGKIKTYSLKNIIQKTISKKKNYFNYFGWFNRSGEHWLNY